MGKLDEMLGEVWEPVILSFANKKSGMDPSTDLRGPGHTVGL